MKKNDKPIIVEQIFHASKETVWNAITDINQMRLWFFDNIPDFKPQVGFKVQFNVNTEKRSFLHLWEIIEVIPFSKIVYNWKYKDYLGDSHVTFELFELNKYTTVKLTTEVLSDFDDTIPEFKRESCIGGWKYFIQDSLKQYLEQK